MNIFDKTLKKINGPINVVRLEGVVKKVRKVIYVFMDQHHDVIIQTECNNIYSKDIQYYFAEGFTNLKNINRTYDFFLEISATDIENLGYGQSYNSIVNYRTKYILQVRKLFRKLFVFNPKNNKVSTSDYFKNVRLHYMDIRDYFSNDITLYLSQIVNDMTSMLKNNIIDLAILRSTANRLKKIRNLYGIIHEIIKSYQSSKRKIAKKISVIKFYQQVQYPDAYNTLSIDEYNEIVRNNMNYLINKLYNDYQNKDVKQFMTNQINVIGEKILQLINECDKRIEDCIRTRNMIEYKANKLNKDVEAIPGLKYGYSISSKYFYNMLTHLVNSHIELSDMSMIIFTRFMDIYFLRRFLDKEYITNAITYTGSYHSNVYIELLVKHFDFKITHVAYSQIPQLDKLNEKVKTSDLDDLARIFYPPIRSQCSDITHFPDNFL